MKRRGRRAYLLRDDVPGMPDDLADAVYDMDEIDRDIVLANWEDIGEDGRELMRAYLSLAWFRRTGRGRCRLAAMQLMDPYVPLKVPEVGGGGG